MPHSLLIAVRFHDGRYHGEDDGFDGGRGWPPSPGRLFQALVAGAACGGRIPAEDRRALMWLEQLPPPRIAAPPSRLGTAVPQFVPNNDLDAVGGHPDRVAEIRVGKQWRPRFFDAGDPVLYAWDFDSATGEAELVCGIAARLYQLGRGIDMAAATGTVVDRDEAEAALAAHPGAVRHPASAGGAVSVARPGTLASLVERRQRGRQRLARDEDGRTRFRQPPKAKFDHIGYDAPPRRLPFDLRQDGAFAPRPPESAAALTTGLRDAAADKLKDALPARAGEIERLIVGRGAGPRDIPQRLRIVPIPSIGMEHTDPSIRRVLVEVPTECPIPWPDIEWAFAGLEPCDPATGEILPGRLVSAGDAAMVDRYARPARVFRSVTAVALSGAARRPPDRPGMAKSSQQRRREEALAAAAIVSALRHAGVRTRPSSIRVQREPLHRRGMPAQAFADGSRFPQRALWHAELRFPAAVDGPLVIGDGRFCGLGLMEPVTDGDAGDADVFAFDVNGKNRVPLAHAPALLRSLRRALMSLSSDADGRLDRLFSGHGPDGRADRASHHDHVFLAADAAGDGEWITRLIVVAPWAADRTTEGRRARRRQFADVVHRLEDLRAGKFGRFAIRPVPLDDGDPTVGPARTWQSVTPYVATRNLKKKDDPAASVKEDVRLECRRRGLPAPIDIELSELAVGPRGGRPNARLRIRFATAIRGPLLIGRDSHGGGGLFHARPREGLDQELA